MSFEEYAESVARLRDDHDSLQSDHDTLQADHETLKERVNIMAQGMAARFDKQDTLLVGIATVVGEPPNPLAKTAEGKSGWGLAKAVVEGLERRKFTLWLVGGFGAIASVALGAMAIIKVLEFLLTHQVK